MRHTIPLSPEVLHGVFSRDSAPVLSVDSGDSVVLSTLDAWWSDEAFSAEYAPRARVEHPHARRGHALTGPIAVRGLGPGGTLEIGVERLVPAGHGFTECGGFAWPHFDRLGVGDGPRRMLLWEIGAAEARTTLSSGRRVTVPVRPFLGVMGMPPAEGGEHSTTPPRVTGGNLDCTLLTPGATLFLPVAVPGGLLSVGDGHAAQADGEMSNNGIECAMREVVLTLIAHARCPFDLATPCPVVRLAPQGGKPTSYAVLGLGATLDDALYACGNGLLDLMVGMLRCTRTEALGLASLTANFRITQAVNGTKGVHAVWSAPER